MPYFDTAILDLAQSIHDDTDWEEYARATFSDHDIIPYRQATLQGPNYYHEGVRGQDY